jgi:predicted nuclease of predicted toxin-antitoxin system
MAILDIDFGSTDPEVIEIPLGAAPSAYVDNNLSLIQSMRLVVAALAGKVSGAGGTTVTIRDTADTKNRIVATVDSDGNRTAITFDAS